MEETGGGASTSASNGLKVLVVDDNVDAATMFAMLMEIEGHDVRTAFNGAEAMQSVEGFTPDAVFLDISLPDVNGYRVAEQMRQIPALGKVMLVAMTGFADKEHQERSQQAGFDHHIIKPAEHADVKRLLAQAADRR